jgi:hypothetical protein
MRFTLGRKVEPRGASDPLLFPTELAAADLGRIRLLNVSGGTPADRKWAVCSPDTAREFSAIGYFFGEKVLKEHPVWAGFLTPERERKIESLIQKHGMKAFFLARFLVGLRSPFYLTAGILRVPYKWFLLADFICASIVITFFFGLSYAFGARIGAFVQSAERGLTIGVVSLAVLAVAGFLWFRRRRMRLLDQNPESLFGNKELIFGPASGSLGEAVRASSAKPDDTHLPEAADPPEPNADAGSVTEAEARSPAAALRPNEIDA